MKRVRALTQLPPLLQAYVDQLAQQNKPHDWNVFKQQCREGKHELQAELLALQQGLCAYCEIHLTVGQTLEVEHYLPKANRPERHLNVANMLAGCCRSHNPSTQPEIDQGNPVFKGHYQDPVGPNRSCGSKKGEKDPKQAGQRILNPRSVRLDPATGALPSLIRCNSQGVIYADTPGCKAVGIDPNEVTETIAVLNLNCDRLRDERKEVWESLQDRYPEIATLSQDDVGDLLQPDSRQPPQLSRFWSTTRCYLADLAEAWLATDEAKAALC